jgi:hypothetical protein
MLRRWRPRFSLKVLLALPVVVGLAIWAVDFYPKPDPLPLGGGCIGWYRGMGFAYGPGFLGKRFYKIDYPPAEPEVYSQLYLSGNQSGYYKAKGWYASGALREEAEYFVEIDDNGIPWPDIHIVRSGRFLSPDGKEETTVRDGTGTQTYWDENGVKIWELVLEDYSRKRVRLWNQQGELRVDKVEASGSQ